MMNPPAPESRTKTAVSATRRTLQGQGVAIGIVIGFVLATVAYALN
jgi:type III secretory pathway component EscT